MKDLVWTDDANEMVPTCRRKRVAAAQTKLRRALKSVYALEDQPYLRLSHGNQPI